MQEWKVRQDIYHRLHKEHNDDLNNVKIRTEDDVVTWAVKHFNERVDEWVYPAKSYFVAICYANWLADDFKEHFLHVLGDPDLLYGNDPYFVPYNLDTRGTYLRIISQIDFPLKMKGMVPDVYDYYRKEMMLDNDLN